MYQLSLFVVWQDQNGLSIVSIKLKLQHPCSSLGNDWPGWHIPWLQKCCFEGVCFPGAMDARMCCLSFAIWLQLRILADCAVCIWDQLLTMWWWRILFLKFLLSCHLFPRTIYISYETQKVISSTLKQIYTACQSGVLCRCVHMSIKSV